MLAIILMGMTLTMLFGARGLLDATTGDDAESVEVLASGTDDRAADTDRPADSTTTVTSSTSTTAPTTTTSAPTTTVDVAHPPGEVLTRVGNGAERGGVAGEGTNILAAAGYATLSAKNAETIDVSTAYYLPGYSKDAELVAQLLSVQPGNIFPMPANPGMPVGDAMVVAVLGRDTPYGN